MRKSLKTGLLLGMIGSSAFLLLLFGVLTYTMIKHRMFEEFDSALIVTAQILAASAEADDVFGEGNAAAELESFAQLQDSEEGVYFQLSLKDGTVIIRSNSLENEAFESFHGHNFEPMIKSIELETGLPLRVVGMKFLPQYDIEDDEDDEILPGREEVVLVFGRDASKLAEHLHFLRWFLFGASAIVMTAALIISLLLINKGLAPLNMFASQISEIGDRDLSSRITAEKIPVELLPIAERLNELLQCLETAFERERCFSADVAHELRTPLAGIRSTIEVILVQERKVADYQETLKECLGIVLSMQSMIEKLDLLARVEEDRIELNKEQVNLRDLVDNCWKLVSANARENELTFDNQLSEKLSCVSGRSFLAIVFANIFNNAVFYSGRNARVWVSGSAAEDTVEITVSNTGCDLTEDQIPHVFERFWRASEARTDTGAHSGLGLSLVHHIVLALGGEVKAEVESGVFSIQLILTK